MNILHISDLHLGKVVNGFSMIEDQQYVLNQTIKVIEQHSIDTVVIAGDIYDRSIAPTIAIELWNDYLNQLAQFKIPVLIINGNHDSMKRLDFASELIKNAQINIISKNCLYEKITIKGINFYLLPFLSLEQANVIIDQKITDYNQLKQYIIAEIDLDQTATNVIIDHSYIITGDHDLEKDSAIRPLALGGSEFTNGAVYSGFDLVLAGHIHRHSHIQPNIYYSGSILPYSVGEINNNNGYYIHHIGHTISSEYHRFELLRPMRKVELYLDQIDSQTYSEDYLIVKILDQGQVINPLEKIRVKFPNVMQIDRDFRQLELEIETAKTKQSLADAFADFYNLNSEQEISTESLDYFMKIAHQIEGGEQ